MTYNHPKFILLAALLLQSPFGLSMPLGHHGGIVIHCNDPRFDEESPPPDAKVDRLEAFSFLASKNTDPLSIKVRVNVDPVPHTLSTERTGDHRIHVVLERPITQGRAWIKVTGMSDDGCDQIHAWNVFIDPDGKTR